LPRIIAPRLTGRAGDIRVATARIFHSTITAKVR
jgi:hypothetical protein